MEGGRSSGFSAHRQKRSSASVKDPPSDPEERMTHLSLWRLCTVLDLGEKLRLDPNALVHDALGVRSGFSDRRLQPFLQVAGLHLVKSMIDLAGIDQIVAVAPANVDAVLFVSIECEAGDGQRAGLHDPVAGSSRGIGAPSAAECQGRRKQRGVLFCPRLRKLPGCIGMSTRFPVITLPQRRKESVCCTCP